MISIPIIKRMELARPFVEPPFQLTITLREGGFYRRGCDIANYVVDCSSDWIARRGSFLSHRYRHHGVLMTLVFLSCGVVAFNWELRTRRQNPARNHDICGPGHHLQ